MAEIGLFPLSVALLPSEVIPLHIFEERYRELIEECLSRPTPATAAPPRWRRNGTCAFPWSRRSATDWVPSGRQMLYSDGGLK